MVRVAAAAAGGERVVVLSTAVLSALVRGGALLEEEVHVLHAPHARLELLCALLGRHLLLLDQPAEQTTVIKLANDSHHRDSPQTKTFLPFYLISLLIASNCS